MTVARKLIFSNYYYEIVINEIAKKYEVDKHKMFGGSRDKNIMNAKRMFIYVLRTMFDLTLQEIAKLTNLHHASIIHHTRKFEFFYGKYVRDTQIYKSVESKVLEVEVDEMIEGLEKKQNEIENELIKLYNIKNQKNVRKERKNLLTK